MQAQTSSLAQVLARAALAVGGRFADERRKRGWTLREAASRASLSASAVHGIELGRVAGLGTYVQLARAYGLDLELVLSNPRRAAKAGGADAVHAAMGDLEAAHFGGLGFQVGLDEPYQHFHFAGRADVAAWDPARRALIQIENRTRFPDYQEAAGAWNGKRAYFAPEFARRLGIKGGWASVTNVMVVAWTAEMLETLRARRASFRALCPDPIDPFSSWWSGAPVASGTSATLVVLDPLVRPGRPIFVTVDEALAGRPRHRGYAQLAQRL